VYVHLLTACEMIVEQDAYDTKSLNCVLKDDRVVTSSVKDLITAVLSEGRYAELIICMQLVLRYLFAVIRAAIDRDWYDVQSVHGCGLQLRSPTYSRTGNNADVDDDDVTKCTAASSGNGKNALFSLLCNHNKLILGYLFVVNFLDAFFLS